MKKRKVDWLVTELKIVGGTETFLRNLAPYMRAEGWDVRVISLINGGVLIDELRQEGIPVIELGMHNKLDFRVIPRLWRLWLDTPPDIIHLHLYHASILGRLLAHFMRFSPVIVHQHGLEKNRSLARAWMDRLLASWTTCYVASCQAVSQILQTREKISSNQIRIIYNGIRMPDQLSTAVLSHDKPIGWPVPEGDLSIACIGRLSPEKGQIYLIEALASLSSGHHWAVHTVFIGDGPNRDRLTMRISELRLTHQVTLAGVRRDVAAWLPHFDLFVLPSIWEGISLALLEAMASRLPVVATATGGTPEVVINGHTGLLVSPENSQELANAIEHLLLHPDERQRMGLAGFEHVRLNFTQKNTIQDISKLYSELVSIENQDFSP